jgi:hypothetical protein
MLSLRKRDHQSSAVTRKEALRFSRFLLICLGAMRAALNVA